jgi:hypothetical protein
MVQLRGRVEGIILPGPGTAASGAQMFDRVVGEVARADLLSMGLDAVQQTEGDDQTVLEEFRVILAASAGRLPGACILESWEKQPRWEGKDAALVGAANSLNDLRRTTQDGQSLGQS